MLFAATQRRRRVAVARHREFQQRLTGASAATSRAGGAPGGRSTGPSCSAIPQLGRFSSARRHRARRRPRPCAPRVAGPPGRDCRSGVGMADGIPPDQRLHCNDRFGHHGSHHAPLMRGPGAGTSSSRSPRRYAQILAPATACSRAAAPRRTSALAAGLALRADDQGKCHPPHDDVAARGDHTGARKRPAQLLGRAPPTTTARTASDPQRVLAPAGSAPHQRGTRAAESRSGNDSGPGCSAHRVTACSAHRRGGYGTRQHWDEHFELGLQSDARRATPSTVAAPRGRSRSCA